MTVVAASMNGVNAIVITETSTGQRNAVIVRRSGSVAKRVAVAVLPAALGRVRSVDGDSRGRWLVLSRPQIGGNPQFGSSLVTRLTTTAAVDTSFGSGGSTTLNVEGFAIESDYSDRPVVLGDDGNPTGLGPGSADTVVARLTTTGALDPTFGTNGQTQAGPNMSLAASRLGVSQNSIIVTPESIAITRPNSVVVSGRVIDPNAGALGFLTQINSAGTRDAAFGSDATWIYGPKRSDPLRPGDLGRFIGVEPLFGNIFVAGEPTGDPATVVWKRTPAGARYGAFATAGFLRLPQVTAPIALGSTCRGGVALADARHVYLFTRSGAHYQKFGANGVISLKTGTALNHLDVASPDNRPCSLSMLGAAARTRGSLGGFQIAWFDYFNG